MSVLFLNRYGKGVVIMSKRDFDLKKSTNIEKMLERISFKKKAPVELFILIVVLYVAASVIVSFTANSVNFIYIGESRLPVSAFAGVITSFSNLCLILLTVIFKKPGFIASMVLLSVQFPVFLKTTVARHNYGSLPGLFMNILSIIAIIIIYFNDTRVSKYQERIRVEAVTDRLTQLPNRFACSELCDVLIKREEKFALVSINLNGFKSINKTLGHSAGNDVLIEIAKRWKNTAESGITGTVDFIARQNGDEFAILIRGYDNEDDLIKTINIYESVLEKKLTLSGCDYFLSGSYGYAEYPADCTTTDTLFSYADRAMYEVKRTNKIERICRFSPELLEIERAMEIERKIRYALENETLYFNLQPQYDTEHRLRGFEALARMKDSEGNMVSPADFIPVAEKAGLIEKVDLFVFRSAAKFFGTILKETGSDVTLSINVSVRHLMRNDFIAEVKQVLSESGLNPSQLEIEITESIMIDSAEKALECINEIKAIGIKIAIDDFGTGYSSLSYLNKFPADLLKVDKAFIDDMNSDDSSMKYVEAIISIGHIMNFKVISEGVEKQEQLDALRMIGCDFIQGFIWGRPLPLEEAEKLIRENASH